MHIYHKLQVRFLVIKLQIQVIIITLVTHSYIHIFIIYVITTDDIEISTIPQSTNSTTETGS